MGSTRSKSVQATTWQLQARLFAWLIGDGDMHLEEFGTPKDARSWCGSFSTIRLAPLLCGHDEVSEP